MMTALAITGTRRVRWWKSKSSMRITLNRGASTFAIVRGRVHPAPQGEPLRFVDAVAAERFLRGFPLRECAGALRRFVVSDASRSARPRVTDQQIIEEIARWIAAGTASVVEVRRGLTAIAQRPVEETTSERPSPVKTAPQEPKEEICWPCLLAAASVRALREAAAHGIPFVSQGEA